MKHGKIPQAITRGYFPAEPHTPECFRSGIPLHIHYFKSPSLWSLQAAADLSFRSEMLKREAGFMCKARIIWTEVLARQVSTVNCLNIFSLMCESPKSYLDGIDSNVVKGIGRSEWHHAYLITAPRFLGYSFNPVSFWYIYTEDNHLSMMILEVNNTFDERRMYLLKATVSDAEAVDSNDDPSGELNRKFKKTWEKDFHVSPFNSRKGNYSLTATNPFVRSGFRPKFDNSIILKSSKNHVKLVARVFSDGEPVDASTASSWIIARFLLRWFWVGFLTFPRILKEAFVLFFSRKLHVWLRPEVLPTSLGRTATVIEV
jgi:hypothetical protein